MISRETETPADTERTKARTAAMSAILTSQGNAYLKLKKNDEAVRLYAKAAAIRTLEPPISTCVPLSITKGYARRDFGIRPSNYGGSPQNGCVFHKGGPRYLEWEPWAVSLRPSVFAHQLRFRGRAGVGVGFVFLRVDHGEGSHVDDILYGRTPLQNVNWPAHPH